MTRRAKIYKRHGEWHVQGYGSKFAAVASTFEWAIMLASEKVKPKLADVRLMPHVLAQEEDTCPECGRRTEMHERVIPGGGAHYTEVCTHCEEEVGNWSV